MPTITIPTSDYLVGTNALGPWPVDIGASSVRVALSRSEWLDPAVRVSARFELSLDSGATWSPDPSGQTSFPWAPFPVTFSAQGGNLPVTESVLKTAIPEPSSASRQVRGVVVVSGGTLRTAITIKTT